MGMFWILNLLSVVALTFAKWNISDNTCDHLEPEDLYHFKGCTVELDSNHLLHAKCDMYCSIKHYSFTMGRWNDVLIISVGLKSEEPVTNLNEPTCLYLANTTFQRFKTSVDYDNYGTHFSLLEIYTNDLVEVQQGYVDVIFDHMRAYGIARGDGSCSVTPGLLQLPTNKCQISILGIKELISFDTWIAYLSKHHTVIENIMDGLNEIFFMNNATIPLLKVQLGPPIQTVQKALGFISYFNIIKLDLTKHHFTKIILGECPEMPSVKYLDLSRGEIERIEPRSFDGLFNLVLLNLSYNKLSSIPDAISTLPSLTTVDLTGNKLKNIFKLDNSIRCDVSKLILSKMNIYELRPKAFGSFPNLRHLEMRQCSIREISESTFADCLNVESLDFSDNQLSSLPENVFDSLKSIKELNLAKNKFATFPIKQILPSFNLQLLNLSYNLIRSIPNVDDITINLIDLSDNLIKEWMNPIRLPHLNTLILKRNEITIVTKAMAESFDLIDVDLSENPFNCSPCAVYHFYTWYNETKVHSKEFVCKFPSEYMDLSLLDLFEDSSACDEHIEIPTKYIIIISVLSGIILLILFSFLAYVARGFVIRRRNVNNALLEFVE